MQKRKHPKKLKVTAYWQTLAKGGIAAGQILPQITLKGFWLEKSGFWIDDQIEIITESNQLIIKKAANGN
jgi:hypothetical protein